MTDALASQGGLIAVAEVTPQAFVSQAGLIAVAEIQPLNRVSQAGLIVVASSSECFGVRCQLWSFHRRDGVELFFTSHDEDVVYGSATYKTCGSLNESASEQSSDQGDVGSVELSGILDSDHISAEDVHAGLYDDCYVQVWSVAWQDPTATAYRDAAGWTGSVSSGEKGFKTEVLGPGQRLLQKPLLQVVQPGCRHVFGDAATCGFDAEAVSIVGTVIASASRAYFTTDLTDPGGTAQWARGTVRWTYGDNTGQEQEVTSVDFATGVVILAVSAGFTPAPGDSFVLLPGCDLSPAQCKLYGRYVDSFGGFEFVPGQDFISQTPDVKA